VMQGEPAGGLVYDRGAAASVIAAGSMINRRV
jgi:hypothetical protein